MKVKYSWRQLDQDTKKLVRRIRRSKFNPATIVAMARGGLTLGVKLSHILHKPLLIISAKTYSDNDQVQSTTLLNSSYTVPLQSPVLIVDEIADSGKTLKVVIDHFKTLGVDIKTCTLLYKNRSKLRPDYFIKEVPDNDWIIFPWEK